MKINREERYAVDFPVFLTLQTGNVSRRLDARCIGLSSSGATMEIFDRLERGTMVLVMSSHFGRMGFATVRYCTRKSMKYTIGLSFSTSLRLSDPQRRTLLEKLLRPPSDPQ